MTFESILIDKPVKLKIPPKECEICGGKYIPTSNRQKYCPSCKKLTPEEREEKKMSSRKMTDDEVRTYIDESLIRKGRGGEDLGLIPEDELDDLDGIVQEAPSGARKDDEFLKKMIRLMEKEFDVCLMVMDDVIPVQLTVGEKTYDGIWVEKRVW